MFMNENVLTMRVATLVLNMERLNAMQVITLKILNFKFDMERQVNTLETLNCPQIEEKINPNVK